MQTAYISERSGRYTVKKVDDLRDIVWSDGLTFVQMLALIDGCHPIRYQQIPSSDRRIVIA
jgi:hypothetical protein